MHKQLPAAIYFIKDQGYYCLQCITQHDGHGIMSLLQYEQHKIKEEANKQAKLREKYCLLTQLSRLICHYKNAVTQRFNSLLVQIEKQINECSKSLLKPIPVSNYISIDILNAVGNETINKIEVSIKESLKSFVTIEDRELVSTLYKRPIIPAYDKEPDSLYIWNGILITIIDTKTHLVKEVKLNKEVSTKATIIAVGKRVYAIGGGKKRKYVLDNMYEADIDKGRLIERQHLLLKRYYVSACHLQLFIYAIGGFDCVHSISECEKYDILADEWCQLPSLNVPRLRCAVFTWSNKIYAFGGNNVLENKSHYLHSMEVLGDKEKWESVNIANAPHERRGVHGIALAEGALIYGGLYK